MQGMATDLDLLIDFYQWEIIRIKNIIDENMKMGHFKEVEQDQKAIMDLNQELDVLLELENTHYPEIKEAEINLRMYERLSNSDRFKHLSEWRDLYAEEISVQRRKIEELKKRRSPNSDETQFVDEAILSLLNGEQKGFFLHFLTTEEEASIKIEYVSERLFELKVLGSQNALDWLKRHSTVNDLCFIRNAEEGSLSTSFELLSQKNVLPFKEVLAKIVFALRTNIKSVKTMHLEMY